VEVPVDAIEVDGETLMVFTFPTRSNSPRELSETEVSVAGAEIGTALSSK